MIDCLDRDKIELALRNAAGQVFSAEKACRNWEQHGGDPRTVSITAELAICAAHTALDELGEDGIAAIDGDRQTRRGRLACAGFLFLLMGTDEGGTSADLFQAASLFLSASDA